MMYVNGNLEANVTSDSPLSIIRSKCYIGRSNYHFSSGDPDASACFDDLMLYNRSLNSDEIRDRMNYIFI